MRKDLSDWMPRYLIALITILLIFAVCNIILNAKAANASTVIAESSHIGPAFISRQDICTVCVPESSFGQHNTECILVRNIAHFECIGSRTIIYLLSGHEVQTPVPCQEFITKYLQAC